MVGEAARAWRRQRRRQRRRADTAAMARLFAKGGRWRWRNGGVVVATPVVDDRLTSKIWARVGGAAAPPFPPFLSSFFGMVDDASNPSSSFDQNNIGARC